MALLRLTLVGFCPPSMLEVGSHSISEPHTIANLLNKWAELRWQASPNGFGDHLDDVATSETLLEFMGRQTRKAAANIKIL